MTVTKADDPREKRNEAFRACTSWMDQVLFRVPGWRDWTHERINFTLNFDDEFLPSKPLVREKFELPSDIDAQHNIVSQYMGLISTADALRECAYYFRRYPFRGLPVSKHAHLLNCCEMYFNRFYEFRERMKKYLNTLNRLSRQQQVDVGKTIKAFDKRYDAELRVRNQIHHHARFDDAALSRLSISELLARQPTNNHIREEVRYQYRRVTKEWADRVDRRSKEIDQLVESIASATLEVCDFLKPKKDSEDRA